MIEELRRIAMIGSGMAELTRVRAEQVARDLRDAMRTEIAEQIANLGLATTRDLERLERKVARLEKQARAKGETATDDGD